MIYQQNYFLAGYFLTEYFLLGYFFAEYFSAEYFSAEYFSAEYFSAEYFSTENFSAEYHDNPHEFSTTSWQKKSYLKTRHVKFIRLTKTMTGQLEVQCNGGFRFLSLNFGKKGNIFILNNIQISSASCNTVQELVLLLQKEGKSQKDWLGDEVGM